MKSFLKKPFFLQFIFYFSITIIILGIVQSIIGTMRLYNSSEQSYENLSAKKTYTLPQNTADIPSKTPQTQSPEKEIHNVAENTQGTEAPFKQVTPEKPPISPERKSTKNTVIKQFTSPVQISVNPVENPAPKGYSETIKTVVNGKYFRDTLWKFPIIIDTERVEPRGQMYNESITLGSGMTNLPEVSKVLIHEIGHMIDIYALRKTLTKADPSDEFYKISWKDTTTIKAGVPQAAFLSGYASSNQYEDFAESFVMYVFHNREFLKRAGQNDFLKQKYNFLKTRIFGDAFIDSAYEKDPIPKKIWDVTKVAIKGNNINTLFVWINTWKYYRS